MQASVNVKEVLLAGVLEFWLVLVLIGVTVFSSEGVGLLEFYGRFLADAVGLPGEGPDAYVGVEGPALSNELENVPFLELLHIAVNKINANNLRTIFKDLKDCHENSSLVGLSTLEVSDRKVLSNLAPKRDLFLEGAFNIKRNCVCSGVSDDRTQSDKNLVKLEKNIRKLKDILVMEHYINLSKMGN